MTNCLHQVEDECVFRARCSCAAGDQRVELNLLFALSLAACKMLSYTLSRFLLTSAILSAVTPPELSALEMGHVRVKSTGCRVEGPSSHSVCAGPVSPGRSLSLSCSHHLHEEDSSYFPDLP